MGSGGRGAARRPAQRGAVPDPVILELRYRPPERGANRSADGDTGDLVRADLARQLNASIYKFARANGCEEDEQVELTFYCACGCMVEVNRSLRDYVARGAVVPGHRRPAGDAGHRPC